MDKEALITQATKIYQALNTISVAGYSNVKTLGNCLDALLQLSKDINTYEEDIQKAIQQQTQELMQKVMSQTDHNDSVPSES